MKDVALADETTLRPTLGDDFQDVLTQIARRADQLSVTGQKGPDHDLAYWLQAEREVLGTNPTGFAVPLT
jgi:hypothetical protein